jgi:hypothetical protein
VTVVEIEGAIEGVMIVAAFLAVQWVLLAAGVAVA